MTIFWIMLGAMAIIVLVLGGMILAPWIGYFFDIFFDKIDSLRSAVQKRVDERLNKYHDK